VKHNLGKPVTINDNLGYDLKESLWDSLRCRLWGSLWDIVRGPTRGSLGAISRQSLGAVLIEDLKTARTENEI
jgi:hypothetical protein